MEICKFRRILSSGTKLQLMPKMNFIHLVILTLSLPSPANSYQPGDESPIDANSAEAVRSSMKTLLDMDTVPSELSIETKLKHTGLKSSVAAKFMKRLFEQYQNSEFKPEKGNMVRSILPKIGAHGVDTSLSFNLSGIKERERVMEAKIYFHLDPEFFNRRYPGSGADSDLQQMPIAMATIDSSGVKSELPLLEDFGLWVSFDATKLIRKLMIERYLKNDESYFSSSQNGKDGRQRPYAGGYDSLARAPTFSVAFGFSQSGDIRTFRVGKILRRHEPFLLVYSDDSKSARADSLEEVDQRLDDFPDEFDQKHGQLSKWTHKRVKRSLLPTDPNYYYNYHVDEQKSNNAVKLKSRSTINNDQQYRVNNRSSGVGENHEFVVESKPNRTMRHSASMLRARAQLRDGRARSRNDSLKFRYSKQSKKLARKLAKMEIPFGNHLRNAGGSRRQYRRRQRGRGRSRTLPSRWYANMPPPVGIPDDEHFSTYVESVVVDSSPKGGTRVVLLKPDKPEPLCRKKGLKINFRDIGWDDWIIAPTSFDAQYCSGSCAARPGQSSSVRQTNHAIIQTIARTLGTQPGLPPPCCGPAKMDSLTLLFMDEAGNVVLRNYPKMIVRACACL